MKVIQKIDITALKIPNWITPIIRDDHPGFIDDYVVLHCLLLIHQPKTILEIGTNAGYGTNVICNALPGSQTYTLDLDYESMFKDPGEFPLENGIDRTGSAIRFPCTQLRGDSMRFDYSKYPCEAWFIDGAHDYKHPYHESREAIMQGARLIIYHDADMQEVFNGITDAFNMEGGEKYSLYRVVDTRIAYAILK